MDRLEEITEMILYRQYEIGKLMEEIGKLMKEMQKIKEKSKKQNIILKRKKVLNANIKNW